jgi:hypothetical protein
MGKMRRSFYFQQDMQDRAYKAHVKEKNARRQQKEIMTKLDLPVSSGSEDSITPKEKWVSHYSTWSSDDEAPAASSSGWGQWDE